MNKKFIAALVFTTVFLGMLSIERGSQVSRFQISKRSDSPAGLVYALCGSEEQSDDLVYYGSSNTILVEKPTGLRITIPKELFEDNGKVKLVIYNLLKDEELASAVIYSEHTSTYTYFINQEGRYSVYAVYGGEDGQEFTRDLSRNIITFREATEEISIMPLQ